MNNLEIDCKDGNHALRFKHAFRKLKDDDEITIKGTWGKRQSLVFIATDFYLEETEQEKEEQSEE